MSTGPGPDVHVWAIEDRTKYEGTRPWRVRWRVGKRRHSKSFPTRLAADTYRSQLMSAAASGERFSAVSGVPASWAVTDLTVAQWAGRWFANQFPTWAPGSRSSAADILVKSLPLLVTDRAPSPPATIRADIRAWLASEQDMPAWLEKWSLPLADASKPICRAAQAQMSVRDDGKAATAESIRRMRVLMRALFAAAVEDELIPSQPWPAAGKTRAATRVTAEVDVETLPEPDEVRELLDSLVNHMPQSRGYRVLMALVYFGGLRPGEARALDAADVTLPAKGWGQVTVRKAGRSAGSRWMDEGDEEGDPKMGRRRTVPIPPELVAILRDWLHERTSGRVVDTRSGQPVSASNLDRAWRKVAPEGLVPYDLRHACATLWLRAGVPIGEVANRLGHSPAVLLTTYAGVLTGDSELANQRIEAALGTN